MDTVSKFSLGRSDVFGVVLLNYGHAVSFNVSRSRVWILLRGVDMGFEGHIYLLSVVIVL